MIEFLVGTDFCATDSKVRFIFTIAYTAIRGIQLLVPFALIIWGSLDFLKAVIAGDDKEIKQKRKPFIQRLIAAVIVLLLPILVNIIMKTLAKSANNKFAACWNSVRTDTKINVPGDGKTTDDWNTD